jgi:hypothetical protein
MYCSRCRRMTTTEAETVIMLSTFLLLKLIERINVCFLWIACFKKYQAEEQRHQIQYSIQTKMSTIQVLANFFES